MIHLIAGVPENYAYGLNLVSHYIRSGSAYSEILVGYKDSLGDTEYLYLNVRSSEHISGKSSVYGGI